MSQKMLRVSLGDLNTVRIACKAKDCGAVLELPLAAASHLRAVKCAVCGHDFDPLKTGLNQASQLADLMVKVKSLAGAFDVQFDVPAPA